MLALMILSSTCASRLFRLPSRHWHSRDRMLSLTCSPLTTWTVQGGSAGLHGRELYFRSVLVEETIVPRPSSTSTRTCLAMATRGDDGTIGSQAIAGPSRTPPTPSDAPTSAEIPSFGTSASVPGICHAPVPHADPNPASRTGQQLTSRPAVLRVPSQIIPRGSAHPRTARDSPGHVYHHATAARPGPTASAGRCAQLGNRPPGSSAG